MRILIETMGSRGDVQPYVALGRGLQARGHAVTVATSTRFENFVTEQGLGFAPLSDELVAMIESLEGREALEDMGSFLSGLRTALRLLRRSGPIQSDLVRDGWMAAKAVDPELIIYNSKMGGGPHYADKLRIPAMLAMPFPQLVPTGDYPTIGLPRLPLGRGYNRATYRFVQWAAERIAGRYNRDWRSAHDLPPQPVGTGLLHRSDGSPIPVLHGVSPQVLPPPADWPDHAVTTGYWFLGRKPDWQPPPELVSFLDHGDPPVYVGFGSMVGRNPQRSTRLVTQALQRAGVRGVLGAGWGGLAKQALPDGIIRVVDVPHDWLFPRMAAVVHHGGAGTTAAGLRAGRPTVICPFFGDQPFWGRRVQALGVGSAPIPQKKLSVNRLAAAIGQATGDPEMRRRAEALGDCIRSEDGVANAVRFIEQHVGRSIRSQ